MMQTVDLADLMPGEIATICGYQKANPDYRQKLLAMGLTPNTTFQVIRRAPLGDPIEIKVRNFHLSLRQNEASVLKIMRETS